MLAEPGPCLLCPHHDQIADALGWRLRASRRRDGCTSFWLIVPVQFNSQIAPFSSEAKATQAA